MKAALERLRPRLDSARLDVEILLAAALGRPRSYLAAHSEEALPAPVYARFRHWIERREAGTPVAYLTGRKEFWSLELEITPAVLAPRPETELLVECAIGWLPAGEPRRGLDLGTGTGAIALAIATERPNSQILATDRSAAALEVARRNASRLHLANVSFREGDWYEALEEADAGAGFDVIVSNPPYIASSDAALQTPELLDEPREALTPGPTGLEAIERIVQGAHACLHAGGWLAVEHGADQGEAVRTLFQRHKLNDIVTVQDLSGRDRVTRGRL